MIYTNLSLNIHIEINVSYVQRHYIVPIAQARDIREKPAPLLVSSVISVRNDLTTPKLPLRKPLRTLPSIACSSFDIYVGMY